MIVIWDLDNCLCDDRHRIPLIRPEARTRHEVWRAYHAACVRDAPGDLGVWHRWLTMMVRPIFITSRPFAHFLDTANWLNYYLGIEVGPSTLLMRPNFNHDSSVEVKRALLGRVRIGDVTAAYDDREDILQMYRAAGINNAIQLRIHDAQYPSLQQRTYEDDLS